MIRTLKRWMDGQESAWMPPWSRGRDAREREVRRLRVLARRRLREEEGLGLAARAVRTLAWPWLLPLKAWQGTEWAIRGEWMQEWRRGIAALAVHNIRADILAYGRALGLDVAKLAPLHIADRENQVLLRGIQGRQPSFGIGHKGVFARHCREHGLAAIPLLAEGRGGDVAWREAQPAGDLFFKPAAGYGGRGAVRLRAEGGGWRAKAGGRMTWETLGAWAGQRHADDWLVQSALRPDPRWAGWTTQALGTVRVVTVASQDQAKPRVMAAVLRLGSGEAEVDNFTSGGWLADINPDSGRLGTAYGRNPHRRFVVHPETGAAINGVRLPEWEAVGELARRAHQSVPDLGFVGWDVTLQPSGPVLVEANPVWNIWPTLFLGATEYLEEMGRRLPAKRRLENQPHPA